MSQLAQPIRMAVLGEYLSVDVLGRRVSVTRARAAIAVVVVAVALALGGAGISDTSQTSHLVADIPRLRQTTSEQAGSEMPAF